MNSNIPLAVISGLDDGVTTLYWTSDPSASVTLQIGQSGAAAETPETVPDLFKRMVDRNEDQPALMVKRAGEWKTWTYRNYYEDSIVAAKGFIEVQPVSCLSLITSSSLSSSSSSVWSQAPSLGVYSWF